MDFEHLLNLIRQDSQFQSLIFLRGKLLSVWGEHCCIVTTENPDGTFVFTVSSDIDNKLAELEKIIYQRIEIIVRKAVSSGYPKDLGKLFLNVCKPRHRKRLTENIVMI